MLNQTQATPTVTTADREARVQALLDQLRPDADRILRQMAERLVDLPGEQSFGPIELHLRDLSHDLACRVHEAGLTSGKKRGTLAPAWPAPPARPTPGSSATAPRRG
jgi:hypothetical protein